MAILIQCPDCKEKYKFDNVHGGKMLACKCGKKLEIPAATENTADIKKCPHCGKVGASDRVICVECGYNFSTGAKLKTSSSEERVEGKPSIIPNLISKLVPVIKFAVIPAVVLILAYLIYSSFTGKNYGISKSAPLGTFQKFEGELTRSQIVKSTDTKPIPKEFGVEGKIYTFVDEALKKASKGFMTESISLAVDSQDRIVGITATFFPPGEGVPTLGSKIYLRMRTYWNKEIEFTKNPQFTSKRLGEGKFSYNVDSAVEKNGIVQGKWIKEPGPTALQGSTDTMLLSLNEYKIDSLNPALEMRNSFGKQSGLSGLSGLSALPGVGVKIDASKEKTEKDEE